MRPSLRLNIEDQSILVKRAAKSPYKKGGKGRRAFGGCPGVLGDRKHDNPRAVSAKPLSPFVKGDFDGALRRIEFAALRRSDS